jgi:hypothetical protein
MVAMSEELVSLTRIEVALADSWRDLLRRRCLEDESRRQPMAALSGGP